jgi:cell wall-associated NlpC family hydrolase
MTTTQQEILQEAESCLNVPYVFGGSNPLQGLDCSGLVVWCLQRVGVFKKGQDFSAQGLYDHFTKKPGSWMATPYPGALLFFGKDVRSITHVGIALNERRMIEAGGGDSRTTNISVASAHGAMVRRQPISARQDLVAVLMPEYSLV